MNEINEKCHKIIKDLNLNPRIVTHEPILDFETAARIDKELGLSGTETKTLFLKGKSGQYYIYITLSTERMDSKVLKNLFGEKVSLVGGEEMTNLTGMIPGCMTPFGFDARIITSLVIDAKIEKEDLLILAFGSETMSVEISPNDLLIVLNSLYDRILFLKEQ